MIRVLLYVCRGSDTAENDNRMTEARWLLLIHQLPAKPAYARVKVWRRLQALGAVTVKNSVYALPANAETQEDFAWLAKEIVECGGEAMICEAALVEGLSDHEMQALFDGARDEDYARIAAEARDDRRPPERRDNGPRIRRDRGAGGPPAQAARCRGRHRFFRRQRAAGSAGPGVGPRGRLARGGSHAIGRNRARARAARQTAPGSRARACRSTASPRPG